MDFLNLTLYELLQQKGIHILSIILLVLFFLYLKKKELSKILEKNYELEDELQNIEKNYRNLVNINTTLEKTIEQLNEKNYTLNIDNFIFQRNSKDIEFSEEILKLWATKKENNIKYRECDTNAKKFFEQFGGKIMIGVADFYKNGQVVKKNCGHTWNEITYNNGKIQTIDVTNYVIEEQYSNYRGKEITYNELLRDNDGHIKINLLTDIKKECNI